MMFHWYQKSRLTSTSTLGPVVAPQVTRRPRRASIRSDRSHVAAPTFSTITSTPRFPVSARTSYYSFVVVIGRINPGIFQEKSYYFCMAKEDGHSYCVVVTR